MPRDSVEKGRRRLMRFLIAGLTILAFVAAYVLVETDVAKEEPDPSHDFFGTRDEDCASCHYSINQTLAGGKHAGRPCTTCHDPTVISELKIIMECDFCHGRKHNYTYPECIECHDPHATGFKHDVSNHLCSDCHANETVELDMGPHSWQHCTNCHGNHSVVSNGCDTCHGRKHSEWITGGYEYPECLECHEAMNASFKHNVSNELCKDCHSSEFQKLQDGGHSGEDCTECHTQHQVVRTTCDDERCHGQEHGYSYPKCLECHEPMQATPGSPEFELSDEGIAFAIIAVSATLVLSTVLIAHMRKKEG